MNKNLQERLKKYSTAAAALVTATTGASAQVVYTDVDPDFTHAGGNVNVGLDMDNDATFDFIIGSVDTTTSSQYRFTYVLEYGTVGNAIAGETPSGYNYALALNANDMIDNTLNWIAATNTLAYNVNSANPYNENWNGVTDKYLALRFITGGSTYYGWARLDVQAIGDQWTLKDYAYESTADAGLLAGDMGAAGLNDAELDALVHFINQTDNSVLVKVNGELTGGNVNVVSMAGQIVETGAIENGTYTVNMNDLEAGIYMINVTFAEGSINRKMMVH